MHIIPFDSAVKCAQRHDLNGHKSGIVWLSGLSGSGKSTLAHATEKRLHDMGVHAYVLDGDNIRRGLNSDLSLSAADRRENIRRTAEVAKLMADSGLVTFCAFITPFQASRELVRSIVQPVPYYECFLECPVETCMDRDPKGLYDKVRRGEIRGMTGLDAPFEVPSDPDLTIPTCKMSIDASVDKLICFMVDQGILIKRSAPRTLPKVRVSL